MISNIVILIFLILLNAFFAASEIAFISLNDARIEVQAKDGNKRAKLINKMLKDPSQFLATIQIGITLAGFLSSAFAVDTFADKVVPLFYTAIPSISIGTWRNIVIMLITVILSYFTLVFGELVPKRIAMKYAEKVAYTSVYIIKFISKLTSHFVKLLTISTNAISKMFGVNSEESEDITEEEIRMMINAGEEKGTIESQEKEMINNIFEFNDKIVSEIMVPRNDIFAIDMNATISGMIETLTEDDKYSRIPVYEGTIDEIKGIVYVKDLITARKRGNTKVKHIMKDAYYVSETKPVDELFNELRKNKKQLAIVIDEYGGTAGIVTMEDILEEIVGEIYDEYDDVEYKYEKINDTTYVFEGNVAIYDLEKILDIKIQEGDYDTLAGYLIDKIGKIPEKSEKIAYETQEAIYKIDKVKNKRIVRVKIIKK